MSIKKYYNQSFRSDLVSLCAGVPVPEVRTVFLGYAWMEGCAPLARIDVENRPYFLGCLYVTVLVDQAMHSYGRNYQQFEQLTQYPKFRLGLGHPAHLNPILVFELPIRHGLVTEGSISQVIPETTRLFVDETMSFFREHMPSNNPRDFFEHLKRDTDVMDRMLTADGEFDRSAEINTLKQRVASELLKAICSVQ